MSVEHQPLDGSTLILLDLRSVVLLLMEYQFLYLLGNIGIGEVELISSAALLFSLYDRSDGSPLY